MARLNEPMVSTDSVETLRRKFLRQNRDIARVNSSQSLKIRQLENEQIRLVSENLELRGQILRLETEIKESSAHRIADHALEIKEKMEAQLAEWGSMLAGLGHEPAPRVRSPRSPKRARRTSSLGRISMSEWKRRDTMTSMKDLEAAALQEGRLAPIWEEKKSPRESIRETLSRDEILALRSIVDENSESPDLGPPPVSRFVDEDPVKIDLPTRTSPAKPDYPSLQKASSDPEAKPELALSPKLNRPKLDEPKKDESKERASEIKPQSQEKKQTSPVESQSPNQVAKANLKRKLREEDEKENAIVSKPPTQIARDQPEKIANVKARPIKLPAHRKDARDKSTNPTTQRKPLGAKSSNECINSPKKAAKAGKPLKQNGTAKDEVKIKKNPPPVEIPTPQSPEPAPVVSIEIETETLSAEPDLAVPDTPEATPREPARDTPPPAGITSTAETSRGSRRSRAPVSYAEPNLRDKMRRPSKQLFDAVAGEGKNMRRASQSSGPSSAIKSEERPASWKKLPAAPRASSPDAMASPLAHKTSRASPSDDLPTSVVTSRKKQNAAAAAAGDDESSSSSSCGTATKPNPRTANRRLDDIAAREEEVAQLFDDDDEKTDVYDFRATPKDDTKYAAPEETATSTLKSGIRGGARRSRSRRMSSMVEAEEAEAGADDYGKAAKRPSAARRATMAAAKEVKADSEPSSHDSSQDGDSLTSSSSGDSEPLSARDRVSMRRRSMMI